VITPPGIARDRLPAMRRLARVSLFACAACAADAAAPVRAPAPPPAAEAPAAAPPAPPPAPGPVASTAPAASPAAVPLNDAVLAVLRGYPTDGTHPYVWKRGVHTDGVSRDLLWQGVPLARAASDGGVHCSGITYEVYVRALARALDGTPHPGPSPDDLLALKEAWYVRDGGGEAGPMDALVDRGLGQRIDTLASLRPGDFVQFWRNSGKGHSAVFVSHTRNRDGSLRGMVYWSAQSSSGGIGQRIVSLGPGEHQINAERLYGVRALAPAPAAASGPGPTGG